MITITGNDNGPKWETESLFGRKEELQLLNNLAEEQSSACVLIHGGEGTGKTTLMHSIPWKQHNWLFVSRKFEEQLSAEPYSALIATLVELMDIWEGKDLGVIKSLFNVLNDDFDILFNIVPAIFKIVDIYSIDPRFSALKQVEDLNCKRLSKTSNKEKMGGDPGAVAAAFLRLFSLLSTSSPIVLFLEDMQFADPVSMDVLELIGRSVAITENDGRFILALSYDDDKLAEKDFALKAVKSIHSLNSVHSLHLQDLDVEAINDLVALLLRAETAETLGLAGVIHKKTAGNPFFATQFLRYARRRSSLRFLQ